MGKSGYFKISRLGGLDISKYYIRKVYDKYTYIHTYTYSYNFTNEESQILRSDLL